MGDVDAIIECRIKQVALHKVLTHLYEFPVKDVVLAQCTLAEAYAIGGYMKQAYGHLSAARETCTAGVHDDLQAQRLEGDLLIVEGIMLFEEGRFVEAERMLSQAGRAGRQIYGEYTTRVAKVHSLLGQIAQKCDRFSEAAEHFMAAWAVHESVSSPEGEETMR